MVDSDYLWVFCSLEEKSLHHLLGGCAIVSSIWRKVKNKAKRIIAMVIWLATVCFISNRRIMIIFMNEMFNFTEYMSEVVFNSWMWLLSYYNLVENCNFNVWNILPFTYF